MRRATSGISSATARIEQPELWSVSLYMKSCITFVQAVFFLAATSCMGVSEEINPFSQLLPPADDAGQGGEGAGNTEDPCPEGHKECMHACDDDRKECKHACNEIEDDADHKECMHACNDAKKECKQLCDDSCGCACSDPCSDDDDG